MLSKIVRFFRWLLAEISTGLVITLTVFGVFGTAFGCDGLWRIFGPFLVIAAGIGLNCLTWFIAAKEDRR